MRINNINSMNFNGMWAPVKVLKYETGVEHYNKKIFKLYDMVYHPWMDETKEAIQKQVEKHFWGRTFSVMDIGFEDSHFKCDVYEMNRVQVGNAIRHEDEANLLEQGYTKEVTIGISSDEEFRKLYPNASYAAYAVSKLDPEGISELADEHFSEE